MLFSLWETGSAPYMQALHFFFGLGAFFAPLIAEPFLTTHAEFKVNSTSTNKKAPAFIPHVSNHTKTAGIPSVANSLTTGDTFIKTNESLVMSTASPGQTMFNAVDEFSRKSVAASIQVPYIVIMAWMVAIGLAFWQLAIAHRLNGTASPFNRRTNSSSGATDGRSTGISTVTKWTTICIMSFFFFFYVGMEVMICCVFLLSLL
jgi:FHS family Na+ dependent glucose MFS transporter 1